MILEGLGFGRDFTWIPAGSYDDPTWFGNGMLDWEY
jgi:hypothetical protein